QRHRFGFGDLKRADHPARRFHRRRQPSGGGLDVLGGPAAEERGWDTGPAGKTRAELIREGEAPAEPVARQHRGSAGVSPSHKHQYHTFTISAKSLNLPSNMPTL